MPRASDDAIFNITTANGDTLIDLAGHRSAQSLTFNNTGTTRFRGNASGTTARNLTNGLGGITVAPGAGVVTISTGSGGLVHLVASASQSISNNGSANLNINGNVAGTGAPTLTNNGTGTNYVGMGALQSSVGKIVQDSATSRMVLKGANTYSGPTTVSNGTLVVDGSLAGGGNVTVESGGVLAGAGSIAGVITMGSGSTLAPGTSPGTMTVSNSLTLSSGSFFQVEMWETNQFDQVLMAGNTLTLGGSTLQVLGDTNAYALGTTFTIVKGFTTLDPSQFGNGSSVNGQNNQYAIGYGTTAAGEITLTVIPEPETLVTMGMLALAILLRRRARG